MAQLVALPGVPDHGLPSHAHVLIRAHQRHRMRDREVDEVLDLGVRGGAHALSRGHEIDAFNSATLAGPGCAVPTSWRNVSLGAT